MDCAVHNKRTMHSTHCTQHTTQSSHQTSSLTSSTRRTADTEMPLLGPNQGQYATLSKGCKTLQNDDFY